MRIRITTEIVEIFSLLAIFFLIQWTVSIGIMGYVVSTVLFFMVLGINILRISKNSELSVTLCIPILLSAFQNVGLGICSPYLSATEVKFLTVLNFLYAVIIFIVLLLKRYKKKIAYNDINGKIWMVFILLITYSIFSIILLTNRNMLSIISSARNIFSMFIFYFIGVLASEKIMSQKFEKVLMIMGILVIIIGIYEIVINPSMWRELNITELWTKKGIKVQASGLPTNFYSSETINGHRIRRMTATFADPVNLGAYLFVLYSLAWYRKQRIFKWIVLTAVVLTVSKGALLGILIFIAIYSYYHYSKPLFIMAMSISFGVGLAFIIYASKTGANSVFVHISGLMAALRNILLNPMGTGLGSNGVLARQFSSYSANREITETGLGMVIGQLGLIGLSLYITFFLYLKKACSRIVDEREKIFCFTLLISIIANIFFNEVALSPNSCAAYYSIIGICIGRTCFQSVYNNNPHKEKSDNA